MFWLLLLYITGVIFNCMVLAVITSEDLNYDSMEFKRKVFYWFFIPIASWFIYIIVPLIDNK